MFLWIVIKSKKAKKNSEKHRSFLEGITWISGPHERLGRKSYPFSANMH